MEKRNLELQNLRLCNLWLSLLDHAGSYATCYYMARELEDPQGPKYRSAVSRLDQTYRTVERLDRAIQRYLGSFPVELLEIRNAQQACGLPAFCDRRDYLDQIMMGLTMTERHGKERRVCYRRQIKKILQSAGKGKPVVALSLNQLEAGFIESQQRAAARKAKKAA